MNNIIDAVIVDTSVFVAEQNDFLGLISSTLPSFFSLIEEQNILLLSHPILHEEIKKHIRESSISEKAEHLKTSLRKYKAILPLIDISPDVAIEKIDALELENRILTAFEQHYRHSTMLKFPNPEIVFAKYFDSEPPFAKSGEKKNEFPDAFVIEAIKQYQIENPRSTLLVISKDSDWEKALSACSRIFISDSISKGIKKLQSDYANIIPIFKSQKEDPFVKYLIEKVVQSAKSEFFELANIYDSDEDALEISSIEVIDISDDFIPLKISKNRIVVQTDVLLKISGTSKVFEESGSIWDSEERKYLYKKYIDISFDNGQSEVECEMSIIFDPENPLHSGNVEGFRLIVNENIEIVVDENELTYSDSTQDQDMDDYYNWVTSEP